MTRVVVQLLLVLPIVLASVRAGAAVPSPQPLDTAYPNHRRYAYGTDAVPYRKSFFPRSFWSRTDDFYLFEPVRVGRDPQAAPVVVLLQGYVLAGPEQFDRLIQHLTRRGMTVVYPTYLSLFENPMDFDGWVDRCESSVVAALAALDGGGHVPVARDARGEPQVAVVGHSIGSYVASFLAGRAAANPWLPAPLALLFLDPAGWDSRQTVGIDWRGLGDLAPTTDVVLLSAEDALVDDQGRPATNTLEAVQDLVDHLPVACDHLSAWVVPSDVEAGTALVSDHYRGPQTHEVFDAVDTWGYWPQLSAHLEHAFWGRYASFLHAGGLYAGAWLDASGRPLRDVRPRYPHPRYPGGYACP